MNTIKIIVTEDGSHSLLNEELQETYHSRHGAVQESQHVFINQGIQHIGKMDIRVLEVGLGTGLNALLTARWAEEQKISVHYFALEKFPVPESIWSRLNYTSQSDSLFVNIHQSPWNEWFRVSHYFSIYKAHTTLQAADFSEQQVDIVYFDAFAPNKQPEMWELPMLEKVVARLGSAGIFVTYCAKGQLKRDLTSLGLWVEALPGPPGKREMIRAIKR